MFYTVFMHEKKITATIICALKCEAAPLAGSLELDLVRAPFKHYSGNSFRILVSGPGKENIIESVRDAAGEFGPGQCFINIGIAGCSDTSVKPGQLFLINEINSSEGSIPHYPDMIAASSISEASICTYDKPVLNTETNSLLADMESYWFYNECIRFVKSSRIHLLKIVSDYMSPGTVTKELVSSLIHKKASRIIEYIDAAKRIGYEEACRDFSNFYSKYRFSVSICKELDKLNSYYFHREGRWPDESIYEETGAPADKKESMEIYNEIRKKLLQK